VVELGLEVGILAEVITDSRGRPVPTTEIAINRLVVRRVEVLIPHVRTYHAEALGEQAIERWRVKHDSGAVLQLVAHQKNFVQELKTRILV
jgi:hypothetical protein